MTTPKIITRLRCVEGEKNFCGQGRTEKVTFLKWHSLNFSHTWMFWVKIEFWSEIYILAKNRIFGHKLKFLTKNSIFGQNKNRIFGQKFKFWPKIEILAINRNFSSEFLTQK